MARSERAYFFIDQAHVNAGKADTPRFLITMAVGIGDAITGGLCATDQIVKNDPQASGSIDILCNPSQAEIFRYDPRINRVIQAEKILFPAPARSSWIKIVLLDPRASQLVQLLRQRHFEAIFPGILAPGFYYRLHSPVMQPDFVKLSRDFLSLRRGVDSPHVSQLVRQTVNRYFGDNLPPPVGEEDIPLYFHSTYVQKALTVMAAIKEQACIPIEESKVIMVAPDTTSVITRPPTCLLAAGLAGALKRADHLLVCILPSYTDPKASINLWRELAPGFPGRIFLLPASPRPSLLETTACIDSADILITGDTGVMHLAAAIKKLRESDDSSFRPRNALKTIALFGGTNPSFHGYRQRTIILGKGRPEQRAFRPGILKDSYNPKGRNFFDHISSEQLTDVLLGLTGSGHSS